MKQLVSSTDRGLEWDCIDVTASQVCKQFNGKVLGNAYSDKSYDVVVFNWVLHHAGDATIGLLRDAKRVAKKFILIQEDLKGETRVEARENFDHEWAGTYRGDAEWKALFSLLELAVVKEISIPAECSARRVHRKFYVLKPPGSK